jgi:hypothetical protein
MMGERTVLQEALFYSFSLERPHAQRSHAAQDRFNLWQAVARRALTSVRRFEIKCLGAVDLSGVRAHLEPYYSDVGRPSIDPELMIRMLLVRYSYGK